MGAAHACADHLIGCAWMLLEYLEDLAAEQQIRVLLLYEGTPGEVEALRDATERLSRGGPGDEQRVERLPGFAAVDTCSLVASVGEVGQLGAGLGTHQGRSAYLDYVVPGLLLITMASAVQGTSIMVAIDMTDGIIDRFRTMSIARSSVLTGHVLGSLIQTLAGVALLIGVALGLGFHPNAGPLHGAAAIGILALFAFALIWLGVALGLAAKSVETASNTPMILFLLVFLSSGFVRTETMPGGLRQFAEYQPFTQVTETVRGLLTNAAVGDHAIAATAWSIGIAVAAYLWATRLYNRRRAAEPT